MKGIELKEFIFNEFIPSLNMYNLPFNVEIIKREETELVKGDRLFKKYDYIFSAFLKIIIDDNKYIVDVQGYGNYNQNNDDINSAGGFVYNFKKEFNSVYDLQSII